ncbi:hypothetical protein [Streptosporangium saharense]|uniref:hypothetical protein n=1 Tax=Streptosporangium saharense TaxID=1706840 RepID=UPI00369DC04E
MNRFKHLVAVAGIGAIVTGGVFAPMAALAAPTPAPSSAPSDAPTGARPADGRHGPHGDGGQLAAKLAELLGLDEQQVTSALEEVRTAGGDSRRGDGQDLATALATKLGVTTEKVTEALKTATETLRQQRTTQVESALSERLKAAVSAGTLTQAEADAVLKAQRAGLLDNGPGRGHRGGHGSDDSGTPGATPQPSTETS